jgi:rfaE bifunctional protein nucleotidyltransferase chain/domain
MTIQERINRKIISGAELGRELARLNLMSKKIVFTNGCFDIIHRGHVEYLSEAANLGDILIIGLNSDSSVKKLKGPERPVQDQETRAKILSSMFFVSFVVIFDEETPHRLISEVKPDVLVKGGDYKIENIVGYDIVKAKGGEVLTIPFVDGHSTTSILQKLGN